MDRARKECNTWVDRCAVERELQYSKPSHGIDNNSFDAVGIVKRKTDEGDPYYIYEIGNRNYMTEDVCDYVFKTSRHMAEMAISMDQDGPDNILQMENAYFDATHSRVHGFKTIGLWMVHPAMLQILHLASMELRSENYIEISRFFTLFNRVCSHVKGESGYKFNPRFFICDEGGANWKALHHIYGEQFTEARVRGCQWHFKSDVWNYVHKVGPDECQNFSKYCHALCDCTTIAQYNEIFAELKIIGDKYPEVQGFLKYWDFRKSHVFGPFRGCGVPGVNLSEPANHTFKPPQTLSLVEAAKYDVATMMWQETQIDLFERNLLRCAGWGPSKGVRDSRECSHQMKVAADFINILDNHGAVMLEAEEAMNPAKYVQKKGTHKAPSSPKTKATEVTLKGQVAVQSKGKMKQGKENVPGKPAQRVIDEEQLQAKCILIMEIVNCDLVPEAGISLVKTPPFIIKAEWNIRKCKGCKK